MSSSLAAQLSQIAAKSSNELDLKAQKASHSQSLIFEAKIAGSQDFDTIFQVCQEGFQELCILDRRFLDYGTSIFSAQSRTEDRTQMTAAQNDELNAVLEDFLGLVGSRLLLKPAIKATEWLIRRFRVHEYNTSLILLTFLPYHDTPLYLNLLSILPHISGGIFKFLRPYIQSLTPVPRQPIVYSATTDIGFFTALNKYVLKVCEAKQHYHGLLSFWSGIASEAVMGMLELAQSGRRELQRQKKEDVLIKVLPMLDEAFKLQKVPELRLGCYMVIIIIANKADLGDKAINGLMESVVDGWSPDTVNASLVCLSVLAERKQIRRLPRKVVATMARVERMENVLSELGHKYNMVPIIYGYISGVLHRLQKGKGVAHMSLVESLILLEGLLNQEQVKPVLLSLLKTAHNLPSNEAQYSELRNSYSDMLQRLNESSLGPVLQSLIKEENIDVSGLKTSLRHVLAIESDDRSSKTEDAEMTGDSEATTQDLFAAALEHVPERTVDEFSLLAKSESRVFKSLEPAFLAVVSSSQSLDKFRTLLIFRQDAEAGSPLFWSFFVRVLCGPYPAPVRIAAIRMAVAELSSSEMFQPHMQIIFPYMIFGLADELDSIRKETCKLMIAFKNHYDDAKSQSDAETSNAEIFSAFYGVPETEPHWLSRKDMSKLVSAVFTPFLEEFALDQYRVGVTVERALCGASLISNPQSKVSMIDLKKSIRSDFFLSLKSHIINTPLYLAKLRLLDILKSVEKVGSISCGKEFLPLLREWSALPESTVIDISAREGIAIDELEKQISTIISPNDRETLSYWLSIMKNSGPKSRSSFRKALFDRIQGIWPQMKIDRQQAAADFLLEGALDPRSEGNSSCREVLQSVPLHTDVLVHLVAKVEESVISLPERLPPSKRRRTSKEESSSFRQGNLEEFAPLIQKMTFILELVDSSKPENHPGVFTTLFNLLTIIQQFKTQLHSDLAYVQNLALSSLLAIVKKSRTSSALQIDTSAIRVDLIVDCVRHTQSHQVQNTALLLIANLAHSAPDLVLHSVMPMFTFLGADILKHSDEYSTYVIDQTIEEVIPPLVQSLRDQKRDVINGASELLHSFTTAFDHIPSHRRLRLFKALVTKLGANDFLFAVLAILAEKYEANAQVKAFAVNLALEFGLDVQLNCFKNILQLAEDSLKEKPIQAQILLGVGQEGGRDPSNTVIDLFKILTHLLRDKSLIAKVNKVLNDDTMETTRTRDYLSNLVEQTLDLAETLRYDRKTLLSCNDVLASLLGILSITELIKTTGQLLAREDEDFRRKILKLLEARIRTSSSNAASIFTTALEFIPTLTNIIESSAIPSLRQAAVACVDQICEKYGKKDISRVVEAAKMIAGDHCFGQPDERTQVISALCLASMIEVFGEALVPVLPAAIPRALQLLTISLQEDEEKIRLHNAIYSMVSAVLAHLPWMMSGNYLRQLLKLCYASANTEMGEDCDTTRRDVLQLLAKKVDLKSCIAALELTWSEAVSEGPKALSEALSILSTAIEKSPKSAVVANAQGLRTVLLKAFDLRRLQFSERTADSYEDDAVARIETTLDDVAIKMIYKMNDSTFRPLFVNLVEWATTGLPKKDAIGRTLRLTTFYSFLSTFFSTLKSIVTSYISYVMENAVDVLNQTNPKDPSSRALWQSTILTLTHSFDHDQDDFWQSPHHFSAIFTPLLSQLPHASSSASTLPIDSHLIPAIVALAGTIESPDHHKSLNSALMKHMRDEHAAVRLAAVKTEISLTEKMGEEWLGLLPEMLPFISEALEDEDEGVERETRRWVAIIEGVLGESLEGMLQ